MRHSKVSNKQLLEAFDSLCKSYGVESAGFDRNAITAPIDGDKHDGKKRWAMHHKPGLGWMIVSGWKGWGINFTRSNGYIRSRWDFLMMIEALWWVKTSPEFTRELT